jgi:hypothetical protein
MRTRRIYCVVFLIISLIIVWLSQQPNEQVPQNYSFIFPLECGVVRPNSTNVYSIEFYNPSTETWRLKKVNQSCSCTVPQVVPEEVPPGGKSVIHIQYKSPSGNRDDRQTVDLEFDAPCLPRITIAITSKSRDLMVATPEHVNFRLTQADSNLSFTLRLDSYDVSEWRGVTVTDLPDFLKVKHLSRTPTSSSQSEPGSWKIELDCLPSKQPIGHYSGTFRIAANDGSPHIDFPYHITIDDGFTISPQNLNFGQIRSGEHSYAMVTIAVRGDLAKTILAKDITISDDNNCVTIASVTANTNSRFLVKLKCSTSDQMFSSGKILFKANNQQIGSAIDYDFSKTN